MWPDEGTEELPEELTKNLSIIYHQFWLTGKVTDDWKLTSVMPILRMGWKEDSGNYRLVSLASASGKIMKQIILSVITWHVQDN